MWHGLNELEQCRCMTLLLITEKLVVTLVVLLVIMYESGCRRKAIAPKSGCRARDRLLPAITRTVKRANDITRRTLQASSISRLASAAASLLHTADLLFPPALSSVLRQRSGEKTKTAVCARESRLSRSHRMDGRLPTYQSGDG